MTKAGVARKAGVPTNIFTSSNGIRIGNMAKILGVLGYSLAYAPSQLRGIRKERGVTIKELAKEIRWDAVTITKLEKGRDTVSHLLYEDYCNFFNLNTIK